MRERTTKKQQELLQFISDFLDQHNYAPSYREIMRALGYKSVSTVAIHVNGLIAKNYLTKTDKSARSIRVVAMKANIDDKNILQKELEKEIKKREDAGGAQDEIDTLKRALDILGV